jgi:two-component system cell cycle sensor histidine kinase/response regulator CckA
MSVPASILVVEDEALIADDLERTLRRLGYAVPAVIAEGERALEAAERHAPSLVLMDIKLKGRVDGIDAARAIQDRFETPIVFLTSHSDAATLSRASTARPQGYVMKPFVERDLRVAIDLALHKHEVERTLRARERWFSTTLHSIGDGVLATDDKVHVTVLNRAAELLTGWSHADAVGKPLAEVLPLLDARGGHLTAPAAEALVSGQIEHLPTSVRLVRKDGQHVLVDDSAAPIIDASGRVLGAVVVFRDVTQRRDLELRVSRSERLASLGTMAAGLCHEINNPLTCVLSNVEHSLEALDAGALRGELREALVDARDAAARIVDIVRGMRAFAQPGDERRVPVDLREVLDRAIKLTAHVVRQHARLERHDGPAPTVAADPVRLDQVLVNLLVNAAQCTPPGDADRHVLRVRLGTDAEGFVFVDVEDDGPGIAPEVLPRIFDPFFTTKAPGGGMGLGLSISSSIIDAFGGEIRVDSVIGRGTCFRVRLPASGALPPLATPQRTPAVAPVAARGRVLVVDDEEAVTRVLVRVLGGAHDVEVCHDGRAALPRLLAGAPYDLILCDLMMPNVTGIELYDTLLLARPEQAQRFVFLTGGATTETARAFLARVARPIVDKPFLDLAELRAQVQGWVRRAGRGTED